MRLLREETGLLGKIAIVWLLVLVVIGVGAIDAASIAFTTYKLSDVGTAAASEGALIFNRTHDAREACARVEQVVTKEDPGVKLTQAGCTVEKPTGLVTVEVRKRANTIVAQRIPWTEEFAVVTVSETSGPPSL